MVEIVKSSVLLPNGETMAYRERIGGTETVVLVHGNMTSSLYYDEIMEQLDSQYKVYAVDLRGFGSSTYNQRISGLRDLSEDLRLFTHALDIPNFHLLGWSLGGGVVMQFSADYPERVKSLTLLCSMSTRGYPLYHLNEQGVPDLTQRMTSLQEVEQMQVTKLIHSAMVQGDTDFMRTLFKPAIYNCGEPSEDRYPDYLVESAKQRNLPDIYHSLNTYNISHADHDAATGSGAVERIEAPVLVIWGKKDAIVTEQMTNELLDDLGPKAESVFMENSGHSPHTDALEKTIGIIDGFMKRQMKAGR